MAKTESTDYVLEEQVGHLMRRANQRHTALFAEIFADYDLTPLQFAVIMKLADVKEASQNQLGRLTAMDPNTIKGVVQRLLDREILVRHKSETDLRRFVLELSKEGKRLAKALKAPGKQVTRETLSPLSVKERGQFLALLQKLC